MGDNLKVLRAVNGDKIRFEEYYGNPINFDNLLHRIDFGNRISGEGFISVVVDDKNARIAAKMQKMGY
jgi:ribosome assembly protein YihI (activator of Der GTPase)